MFEYAISCGEGTLLDYGVGNIVVLCDAISPTSAHLPILDFEPRTDGATVIFVVASPDCTAGQ